MKRLLFILMIFVLLISACGGPATSTPEPTSAPEATATPSPEATEVAETTPLIPREVFFGNPDKVSVALSPDGARISYLAPVDGVMNVWVGPADDPAAAQPVTQDTDRGINFYGWAYTGEHILYSQDQAGEENWRIYSVNLNTGETIDLTPLEGVQARAQAFSPEFPTEFIVGLNDRVPQLHDLYRVNIDTGERTLILENEGFLGFLIDYDLDVRFAMRLTPEGGLEYLGPTEEGGWEPFLEIPMEDVLTTSLLWFDKTGTILYMIDSRGRDTSAMFALDLETGEQTLLAEDPRADVSDVMVHPTERNIQAVAFTYERKHWQILDESLAGDLAYLNTVADGDVEVVSRTLDDKYWTLAYVLDDGPVQYYYYDHDAQEAHFLFAHRQELEGLALSEMHPVIIESRDGLSLVSYYTLPVGSDSDGDGRPDEPLPMVLFPHGGPWSRDSWGYNSVHQWLANRGYAVLSVNFRASTGFGKDFINAGNMEWGGKVQDDLFDAVEWAIQEGIADPEGVASFGGSFGGYSTLWALTNTPEKYACGVAWAAPSNLVTLLESIPPYWEPEIELFRTRVGDHTTEQGRALLTQYSPLTYVDQIQRPLLIGQGANDVRAKPDQAEQIVEAMQEKGIPVTYLLYPDEGHGIDKPENALSLFAVADAFFAECLGGRYEPVGDDFEGSSITVPAGAQEIPGLAEAVAELPATPTVEPAEEPATIELEPFTSEDFSISGVVPVGWTEAAPGTFMRGTPPADITTLIQKSYPEMTVDGLTAQLLPALGIEELPESVGSTETSAFTWDLYKVEVEAPGVGTVVVDIALAETDSTAYLVLLQALADDYDALHEPVFLPAVDALAPLY
jgi:dipeptidyl aminopeptidase/acylaminoacyl peptidase